LDHGRGENRDVPDGPAEPTFSRGLPRRHPLNAPKKPEDDPAGSWFDEISLSTKIVFVVTLGSVLILAVLYIVDLFV
jgi:hypothetical protein